MEICCDNASTSRRKLVLKRKDTESNLKTALIVYHPPEKIRNFARNLTASKPSPHPYPENPLNKEKNPTNSFEKESTIKNREFENHQSSRILYFCIFFLLFLLAATLMLTSSQIYFKKCPTDLMQFDLAPVTAELKSHLFGQSIAQRLIADSFERMKVTLEKFSILVLMGGPGTGKTWTTNVISYSVPTFVKKIYVHLESTSHQDIVLVISKIECCRWNILFVEDSDFVNISKIELFLEILREFISSSTCPDLKLVVMITSGIGQKEFASTLFQDLKDNHLNRERLDLEKYLTVASQLDSPLLTALTEHMIDFTPVPYLPLGRDEVESCIKEDLKIKKKSVSEGALNSIMLNVRFFPADLKYFSVSGCKSVSTKVNLHSE